MLESYQLPRTWGRYLPFVDEMRARYGRGLDPEECQAEVFAAIVEAQSTYPRYAGRYCYEEHLFLSVRNVMISMHKKHNEIISLESTLSLDGQAPGGGHTVGDYFLPQRKHRGPRRGLEANAIVRTFLKELILPERQVLLRKLYGYSNKEIERDLKLSRQEFRALERSLQVKAKAYFKNLS